MIEVLKRYALCCLLVYVVALIYPNVAVGDDPCDGNDVPTFAASLPKVTGADLRQGTFRVTERDRQFAISYVIGGKTALQSSLPQATNGRRTITPIRVGGYSALFIRDDYGGSGVVSCLHIVFPSLTTNRFSSLRIEGYDAEVQDLDADGETEIVVREWPPGWVWDCPFANAYRPYWHRIIHLSPQVDISDQFPQYYAALARTYKETSASTFSTTKPPSRCQQYLQQLISQAEAKADPQRRTRTLTAFVTNNTKAENTLLIPFTARFDNVKGTRFDRVKRTHLL